MKKKCARLFVVLGCIACLICIVAVSVHIWNVKYYDEEEVLELFQSVNPDIYMADHIPALDSRLPSQLNNTHIIELRDASSSDEENEQPYIWILFYYSESEVLEEMENLYIYRPSLIAYDKNIIIYDCEDDGSFGEICKTLFPETYQKTS
ncbi:MAG: hypothetical protein IJC85_01430 [Oscillospiraceae bacterium]|nr:hypothetical protein [Oscillospiraceae bacterium]